MKDAAELLSQAVEPQLEQGIVKWFSTEKGYGFIKRRDGSDVFVHFSEILGEEKYKSLIPDQPVEFSIDESSPKGPKALRVKVAG